MTHPGEEETVSLFSIWSSKFHNACLDGVIVHHKCADAGIDLKSKFIVVYQHKYDVFEIVLGKTIFQWAASLTALYYKNSYSHQRGFKKVEFDIVTYPCRVLKCKHYM